MGREMKRQTKNAISMKLKRLTLALLLLTAAVGVNGQEVLRLSLDEAQQYAIEHNQTMKNASLDVKKAEMERWKTLSTMLPQVKAGFDYQNMCGYKMKMSAFTIPMDPTGTYSLTASMALTGAQVVGTMLQNIALRMSDITRQQTEQETRSQVKNIYASILVMEQTVGLLDSSLANLERLAATSQASVDVGAAEQVDADKLQVQVATMKSTVNSTRRSLQMLRNSLLLQLGAAVTAQVELTTPIEDIMNVEAASRLLGMRFDISRNYSYQLLQQNEKLAKGNVAMAWMDFTPTVSAYYQYSKKVYFGDEGMNMTPPNMIGASVSLPLFQSGTRTANLKSMKIALQETVNSKHQAEDGLKVQYNQLCFDLTTALETYDIQSRNLDVSKRVFDNITEKYKYGRASSLEVTNASTDIISAQSNYIQAVMNVVSAQLSLENLLNVE